MLYSCLFEITEEIFFRYSTAQAGAFNLSQIDAVLLRHVADDRRDSDAFSRLG